MSEIRIEELTARYDASPVLTSVDLVVPSGSLTCVLGESGCGKTTLLRVIAGFTPARSGRVRIGDRIVDDGTTRVAPEKRRVGYVPQEGALFPHLTVADNIGFALPRRTGAERRARAQTVGEMLQLVQMPDHGGRYPHELSGGQQQRISIARALANQPEVVLLDEPFASLDATLRGHFREEIREVLRTAGATAILVTHDRSEALSLGDHVAVINAGRVHQTATPTVLYTQPADAHVATFVGDANLLPCTIADGRAVTALGPLDVHPACPIGDRTSGTAVVRPEHVHVHATDEVDPTRHPGAVGVLTRAEYYGHDARLEVRLDATDPADAGGSSRTVIARIAARTPPAEGTSVAVCVDGPVWILADPEDATTP